MESGNDNDMIK